MSLQRASRTQVLLTEATHAQVKELAKKNKRSMSAECAELIELALRQQLLAKGSVADGGGDVPLDALSAKRLKTFLKLLDSLE